MATPNTMQAHSRHILVQTEEEVDNLLDHLKAGADFAELAAKYSRCPSSSRGGDLGWYGRGRMVPEFDAVSFDAALGEHLKVKTQFGWHLMEVLERKV